jgi:hypothetical protein
MVFERRKSRCIVTRDIAMAMSRAWASIPGRVVPHPTRPASSPSDLHWALPSAELVTGAVAV